MPVDMKAIIAEAYLKMLQYKSVDKITVKALLDECNISRQTFYYHFRDIMDVMEWSLGQATRHLVEESLKAEDMHSALGVFISFTVENHPKVKNLMESQRRKQFEELFIESVEAYLTGIMRHRSPDIALNYTDMEIILRYSACGIVGVLLTYVGKPGLDQERLILRIESILNKTVGM